MARTSNGNLTGKAAQSELSDMAERLADDRAAFVSDWKNTLNELESSMTSAEFETWWDSYPAQMSKAQFLPIMKSKLGDIERAKQAAEIASIDEWLTSEISHEAHEYFEEGCGTDSDLPAFAMGR